METGKKYYHLISKEESEYAMSLPDHVFRRLYQEPKCCQYSESLDRQFGCSWIFKDEEHRINITKQCNDCACVSTTIKN